MTFKNNRIDLPGFYKLIQGRDGLFLANENDIYVGGALIKYGEFSYLEMEFFEDIIDGDSVVVEVGANIGAHTVGLAKLAKEVIAFEPQPQVFYNLCSNIALNSLQNVRCHNFGLGEKAGIMGIPKLDHRQRNNYGGMSLLEAAADRESVEIRTLDDFCTKPSLLKIDVEGMELPVLKGAVKTISSYSPIMYIENDRREKSKALIEYLFSIDYRLWWHCPKLFNPDNFFGKKEDYAPNIVSVNMICVRAGGKTPKICDTLPAILSSDKHCMDR